MTGHAARLLAYVGACAGDPACPSPALVRDDDDPNIMRCAAHAHAHLRRLTAPTIC